jgi:hypothetical protein
MAESDLILMELVATHSENEKEKRCSTSFAEKRSQKRLNLTSASSSAALKA